jgi:hypothetical protein
MREQWFAFANKGLTNMIGHRVVLMSLVISSVCGELVFSQYVMKTERSSAAMPARKLPDTGQSTSYTTTFGEDADYVINAPTYAVNGNGTVTDNVTGLMWQQTDGGEMTIERATIYCDTLTLGNFSDWRLPTSLELYGIVNMDKLNPALDTTTFKKTAAEYWWTSERQASDTTRVWVVNAGGGIGPHPKTETIGAGGTKRIHVRAVRVAVAGSTTTSQYQDNGDSTVTDLCTGLTWQKYSSDVTMTWEQAIAYAESITVGGKSDWRLPNVKELQSINDVSVVNPSLDRLAFPGFVTSKMWTSTSQFNASTSILASSRMI